MTTRIPIAAFALLTLLAAWVAGCAQSQQTRFYSLASISRDGEAAGSWGRDRGIVVGPVSLPKYLDRPQVVTRPGVYAVAVDEFNRWVEPLEDMVPRVLAENLSALLATDQVVLFSQRRLLDAAYQVEATIYRFDLDDRGAVVLTAQWNLVGRTKDTVIVSRKSTVTSVPPGDGAEAVAAAMSAALADLSREIAGALIQAPR